MILRVVVVVVVRGAMRATRVVVDANMMMMMMCCCVEANSDADSIPIDRHNHARVDWISFRRKCTRVRVRRVQSLGYLFFFIDAGEGRDEGVVYDALVWFFNTHSSRTATAPVSREG
jgi:hypothetical protein